jgi:cytoskeletal protein RodZ
MQGALDSSREPRSPGAIPLRDFDADGAAFGDFLRLARERRGLTLQQISSETKIPWRHLDALEHGRLNAVPGGTYRRGEIRAYAEVVGIDKSVALARLDRALESADPLPPPQPPSIWSGPNAAAIRNWALVAVAVAIAAALVITNSWSRGQTRTVVAHDAATPRAASRAIDAQPAARVSNEIPPADLRPSAAAASPVAPAAPAAAVPTPAPAVRPPVVSERAEPAAPTPAPAVATAAATSLAAGPGEEGLVVTSDPPGARVTIDGVAASGRANGPRVVGAPARHPARRAAGTVSGTS